MREIGGEPAPEGPPGLSIPSEPINDAAPPGVPRERKPWISEKAMPICASCGVELEEEVKACPLCGRPVDGSESVEERPDEGVGKARRLRALEAYSVVSVIAAVLCLGVDLWTTKGSLGWSLSTVVNVAMAWLLVAMPLLFIRKPWLLVATLVPGELLLIFLLNLVYLIQGTTGLWFFSYGAPIYVLSIGLFVASFILGSLPKVKGLNIPGIILAAAALECLGLEAIITLAGKGRLDFVWSPIVALACVPLSGLCFYFHYRVMKRPLRRSLHL